MSKLSVELSRIDVKEKGTSIFIIRKLFLCCTAG